MDATARDQLIDDFLMDRLGAAERKAFEARIAQDKELQEEVRLRKTMIGQVTTIGDLKLRKKILQIQEKVERPQKKPAIRRYLGMISAIAAGLLLLFLAYQWWNTSTSPGDLYAHYYQAYDQLPFQSRSTEEDPAVLEAGALYRQGRYAEALPRFQQIVAGGNGDDRIILAIAICQLEGRDYEAAVSTLRQASRIRGFLYKDQAKWYLALAHLRLGQTQDSRRILQTLADFPASRYSARAQELLEKIK